MVWHNSRVGSISCYCPSGRLSGKHALTDSIVDPFLGSQSSSFPCGLHAAQRLWLVQWGRKHRGRQHWSKMGCHCSQGPVVLAWNTESATLFIRERRHIVSWFCRKVYLTSNISAVSKGNALNWNPQLRHITSELWSWVFSEISETNYQPRNCQLNLGALIEHTDRFIMGSFRICVDMKKRLWNSLPGVFT